MFKEIGQWFDNLFIDKSHDVSVTHDMIETTIKEKTVDKKPVITASNFYHHLSEALKVNGLAVVTRYYDRPTYTYDTDAKEMVMGKDRTSTRILHYRQGTASMITGYIIGDSLSKALSGQYVVNEESYAKLFGDNAIVTIDVPNITSEDEQAERVIIQNLLKKAKPYTAIAYRSGVYIGDGHSHIAYRTVSEYLNNPPMLVLAFFRKELEDDVMTQKYVITDADLVDYRLLPNQHWRRWVSIKEVVGADSKWTLRYVPRNIGRGVIRYFHIELHFDTVDLKGVCFDLPQLLTEAIQNQINICNKELLGKIPEEAYAYADVFEADTYVNIDTLMVTHSDLRLTAKMYVTRQNKHIEFHDVHPYFNPNASELSVNGCYFGFDGANEFYYYHSNDFVGDQRPNGKHKNHK